MQGIQAKHTCSSACGGFLQCAGCDELVGFCEASEGEHVGLCRACGSTCAYCGAAATGADSIHRDGFGLGPEVVLCDPCGTGRLPSAEQIWYKVAKVGPFADAREMGVPLLQLLRDVPRAELIDGR
jgi:hypothetical protein